MQYAPRLPFGASLTSWGISTIMIIGSLAISANKRNISKDKRTVPLSSNSLSTAAAAEYRAYKNSAEYALSFYISSEYVEAYDTIMTNFIQKNTPGSIYRTKDLRDEINKKREELGDALGDFAKIQQLVNENVGPWYGK